MKFENMAGILGMLLLLGYVCGLVISVGGIPAEWADFMGQPVFGLLLICIWTGSSAILAAGISLGAHNALQTTLGVSNSRVFGGYRDAQIGLIPALVIGAGSFGAASGVCWLPFIHLNKANQAGLAFVIGVGGLLGIWPTLIIRDRHFKKRPRSRAVTSQSEERRIATPGTLGALIGGAFGAFLCGLISYTAFDERVLFEIVDLTITPTVIAVFVGCFAGGIPGLWLGKGIERFAHSVVGHTPAKVGREIEMGIVVGCLFGSLVGLIIGVFAGIYGGALIFVFAGGVLGLVEGFVLWAAAGGMTVLGELLARIIGSLISPLCVPLCILLRYNTIICEHCLRYTRPFQSRYEQGIRYCEHCRKPVERTDVTGKVIFTFGQFTLHREGDEVALTNPKFELLRRPNRVFICSNPGFREAERGVDVAEVYIDTATCDPGKLERFLTYISQIPPENGVQSIHVFYQGELDELGENLKHALRNTFPQMERIYS